MSFKNYVKKVVMDAFEAEGRPYNGHEVVSATFPDGEKAIFIYGVGHYARVRRRIEYRLNRNLAKHFPKFSDYLIYACDGTCVTGRMYHYMDEAGNETNPASDFEITMKLQKERRR